MSRFVDRGALTAAYVGIGVAITVAVSFLLIIPIEPVIWLLSIPAGLVIGYYANQRSNRRAGPWSRILRNGVFAGFVTGLTTALLILVLKSIFFYADTGYPDFNRADQNGQPIPPYCQTGADCVYQRYLKLEAGTLANAGVTDTASFARVYWDGQWSSAGVILASTTAAALLGGALFGIAGPRSRIAPSRSPAAA